MFVYVESSPLVMRGTAPPYSVIEIAKRLVLLRRALGLSQSDMGRLAGVSGNAWGNYENADRRIEPDRVFELENNISVPLEWVYRGVQTRLPLDLAQKIELAKRELERTRKR